MLGMPRCFWLILCAAAALCTGSCSTAESFVIVCGQPVPCSARVINYTDPQGFDAHSERCAFREQILPTHATADTMVPRRYGVRSTAGMAEANAARVAQNGWSFPSLQQRVDQFVLHYDACHDSTQCFEVLQDQRGLSVHFLLDLDGTIYQTLDLVHRARHATKANDRSIGIEIAQLGARADAAALAPYYADAAGRTWLQVPQRKEGRGFLRTGMLVPTARVGLQHGRINGRDLVQHDFTEAQYQSLTALLACLRGILPRIADGIPVDTAGQVLDRCLTDSEFAAFSGVLGHFHIQPEKSDPGVAFDWSRIAHLP